MSSTRLTVILAFTLFSVIGRASGGGSAAQPIPAPSPISNFILDSSESGQRERAALGSTGPSVSSAAPPAAAAAVVPAKPTHLLAPATAIVKTALTSDHQQKNATVSTVPVKVLYVAENQPVQIVDSQGRLIQVIYLRKTASQSTASSAASR